MSSLPTILPDADALIQIKEGSRKLYIKAFNQFREYIGNDLEARPPTEQELLSYVKFMRLEKGLASSSLWTTYSMINGVCKGKYSINLKQYCRVTSLIKSFDVDVKSKAATFSSEEINKFIGDSSISSPYWLVRKVTASVAFYGGLRLSEMMNLSVEKFESSAEGVYVTHMRSKQRSDKQTTRYLFSFQYFYV